MLAPRLGMSVVGLKPIVEIQFADYILPELNQLFTEVNCSCYFSNGKWPTSMILRVPIGAYGSGGPYHLSSIENMPAVPLNSILEQTMIPSTEKVKAKIQELLSY